MERPCNTINFEQFSRIFVHVLQNIPINLMWATITLRGPDSSVGIATRYGLDGPVIESRWG